ncbi:MAG: acyl-ACP--UDP-N-acetylglucosamine O-acyltransferase [Planctomycetota bacterium]|jgi:UDP-N-acetylglucosamine acyltransferase
MPTIHSTAIVDSSAEIAASVKIGPYCVIGPEVRLSLGTVLHNHVTIQALTSIGEDNEVYPFVVLGADPQDRKFQGERAHCVIGDRNRIREHVTVHRGTHNGGGVTQIGNDNLIMVSAHIAHDCRLADHLTIANQVMLAGHVQVEDGANIGGGAGVHHFATVGTCAFVGGLARITKDVPPFMIVEGNPAEVRAVNSIAMTRQGYDAEHIEAVKDAFRRLFRENDTATAEKLDDLRRCYPHIRAVMTLCDALAAAANGIHGRAREVDRADNKRAVLT